jgi:hypothetical protein
MARRRASKPEAKAPAKPKPTKKTIKTKREASPKLKSLTYRQRMFIAAYLGQTNGNATEAARIAGYASPRVDGARTLANVGVRAQIEAKVASVTLPSDEVLARIGDFASIDVGEFITTDANGQPAIDLDAMKRAGKTHLIKGIRYTKFGTVIELHDAHAALEKLGKYHRLFVDRTEVSGPNSGSIAVDLAASLDKIYGDSPPDA